MRYVTALIVISFIYVIIRSLIINWYDYAVNINHLDVECVCCLLLISQWHSIIDAFRTSMPIGCRRHLLRSYDNCFIASDAVTWLHRYLQRHPSFGLTVTRSDPIVVL